MAREDAAEAQIQIPAGAVGYKLRMIFGKWWLCLFNESGKNLGDYGPMVWAEVPEGTALIESKGLVNLEKNLGDRGR